MVACINGLCWSFYNCPHRGILIDFCAQAFQEIQQTNESKVSTIEQSAGSEEVQKALEKNPDISKERNNLLQGEHIVISCMSTH